MPSDVVELDGLLSLASQVIPLREVHARTEGHVIALRHDVDDNEGSLDAAVRMAAWEAARGYRSTYFILHTAHYWDDPRTPAKLAQIEVLGHEIGLHVNAIPQSLDLNRPAEECILMALHTLSRWGFDVMGVAPHGDGRCYGEDGSLRFVNDEVFEECQRPDLGPLDERLPGLTPHPLAYYGLGYEAYRLPRGFYLSDSGDTWIPSIAKARVAFEAGLDAPLQVLQHPDWYRSAL